MKELINNLEELNRKAEKGGGDARIEKQHSVGKLTARERIDLLLEKGSFIELDKLVTHRCTDFGMMEPSNTAVDKKLAEIYYLKNDFNKAVEAYANFAMGPTLKVASVPI